MNPREATRTVRLDLELLESLLRLVAALLFAFSPLIITILRFARRRRKKAAEEGGPAETPQEEAEKSGNRLRKGIKKKKGKKRAQKRTRRPGALQLLLKKRVHSWVRQLRQDSDQSGQQPGHREYRTSPGHKRPAPPSPGPVGETSGMDRGRQPRYRSRVPSPAPPGEGASERKKSGTGAEPALLGGRNLSPLQQALVYREILGPPRSEDPFP